MANRWPSSSFGQDRECVSMCQRGEPQRTKPRSRSQAGPHGCRGHWGQREMVAVVRASRTPQPAPLARVPPASPPTSSQARASAATLAPDPADVFPSQDLGA